MPGLLLLFRLVWQVATFLYDRSIQKAVPHRYCAKPRLTRRRVSASTRTGRIPASSYSRALADGATFVPIHDDPVAVARA